MHSLLTENTDLENFSMLSLRFAADDHHRSMQVLRQDPPWKIVRSFRAVAGESLAHIHNLSGGVLSGDRLLLCVHVEDNCRVQLTSTGATRIYRSRTDHPAAHNINRFTVGNSAVLEYLPDQTIPYSGSRFQQWTEIDLSPRDAGLFWWETLTPGRSASGERFLYESLSIRSVISCEGKPIAIDQFQIRPAAFSPTRTGALGTFECSSTFYICRTGLAEEKWIELEKILTNEAERISTPEMQWGGSRLVQHGILMRGLGQQSSSLLVALVRFWSLAKAYLYERDAVLPRKVH